MGAIDDLGPVWRVVFDEAWASFRSGNFGIGAALVDPADGRIVTTGRNRVAQGTHEPRTLSGNMTAHAEMNAFAALDRFNADGLLLYTTLEPCLMCAAAAMQLKVSEVHFAASDEFYIGMDELWAQHDVTAQRQPTSTGPLDGDLARFARLLPLTFTLRHFPGRTAELQARRAHPDLAEIADRAEGDALFADIVRSGTADDAVRHLFGSTAAAPDA